MTDQTTRHPVAYAHTNTAASAKLLIGPVAAGWAFDQTDSYQVVLYVGAALMMLAAVVFLALQSVVKQRTAQTAQLQ